MNMNCKLLKTILLLMAFQMVSWTAHGQQCLVHPDSVHISRDSQRQCIKYYKELQNKDKIISKKDSVILVLNGFIEESDDIVHAISADLDDKISDLTKCKDKSKKKFVIGLLVGGVSGGVGGWFLGRALK